MSSRQFGPQYGENSATFRLWAPAAKSVDAVVDGSRHQMARCGRGWFTVDVQGAAAGSRYRFRIDDEVDVPDPASAFQPEDVAGPSEIVDHDAFAWRARDWRGRPWHETVLLECHVGTFSPEGTYDGLIGKLDHIAQTGITAIELMPVGDFPGKRNWGYDGVLWYAPDHTYGSPDDLKRLIDEAHLRGIMVFLDVVYNHFGPEGNLLGRYAPQFFKNASTPWGSAIDYAVPEVKAFAIENALFWLCDYRFDGLRLDAVHAIAEPDRSALLQELSHAVGSLARESGRHVHLVLENDDNRASAARCGRGNSGGTISRAVERRLSPRLARISDRRNARLLFRLCAQSREDDCADAGVRLRLPGRAVRASRRQTARRAGRQHLAGSVRLLPAKP